jgi:hypothetical protein
MNKLLKDAIADAKAVRETALANAKAALEEAFAPKLQSMLSHKIAEEAEGEEGEEDAMPEDEVAKMQELAGILEDEGMPAEDERMPAEDDKEDFSDDDEEDFSDDDEEDFSDEEEVEDDELEELLRELETSDEGEEDSTEETEDPEAYADNAYMEEEEVEEEIDLNELIKALREEEEGEETEEEEIPEGKMKMKKKMMETELTEAYDVIKFLRSKLNEVNLLNAKLLFVNKLFRKSNLTETQKVKIIETFDRAKNVRETKLIYSTLVESINAKSVSKPSNKVNKITEGFASAPQKKTNKILTESNHIYNRFKDLVNYNNNY